MPPKKPKIGRILTESLTLEQIANFLTVVSGSIDLNLYTDKFEKIDPDMAKTVKKVLSTTQDSKAGDETKGLASLQRRMEFWSSLWCHFDDILNAVGDEGGKYAVQDHHWEPPYFDGWSLAEDLEPIAEDMLVLVQDVFDAVDDPDLFSKALEEIDDRIGSYPEWMGADHGEPCVLGEKLTQCVLMWKWLSSQHESHAGQTFAEKAFYAQSVFDMVILDEKAFIGFFAQLPADICREVYDFFKKGDHDLDLGSTNSVWHRINHHYEELFDAGKYLKSCRKHLAENWRYGRPLVEDALEQHDFQTAQSHLVNTFSSYLGTQGKKRWHPETSLLLIEKRFHLNEGDEEIVSLLTHWADVAKRLKNPNRSAAAEFQAVVIQTPEKWDMVLKAYKRLSKTDKQGTLTPLFIQWKNEMAARSYPYYRESHKVTDTWIHWLIDAILDVRQGKKGFLKKLTEWLTDLENNTKAFKKQWHWLSLLTKDLPQSQKLKAKHPYFWKTVLHANDHTGDLTESRCAGLREMKAGSLLKAILLVWKRQLRGIVPDPAKVHKSVYEEHACWAQALFEMNRNEYSGLITQWRKKHNRRRNLWIEMKARHLPIGG
ncbi:MAG: hypothetical protein JRJ85_24880 [Deltaproteobacteria bacterium]|nr:hypothetical protein [Deltaproteobacteria bacterium]